MVIHVLCVRNFIRHWAKIILIAMVRINFVLIALGIEVIFRQLITLLTSLKSLALIE